MEYARYIELAVFVMLIIDKIVAITPNKHDDMIVTIIKKFLTALQTTKVTKK